MIEQYQPANGSEGVEFMNAWCRRCQRDKAMRDDCREAWKSRKAESCQPR